MSFPFRLAVVGVDHPHGAHWRQLLAQFPREIEIVAVVPAFHGAVTSLEESLANVPRFATVAEMLARVPLDGAMVALANDESPGVVAELARAGKHLLVEKPVASTAELLEPVIEAVTAAGVAFQTGYLWRYDEAANRLKRMFAEGQFGKLISVEMLYATSDARRRGPEHFLFDATISGGGFFHWLGCHYLDLLRYLVPDAIVGVTARVGVFGATPLEVEDGGTVILEFESGALATLVGGYWLPRWAGENRWSLRGSSRWVNWEPARPGTSGVLEIHGPQPQWHAMEETFTVPADTTPGYGGRRGVELVADWLRAARGGGPCRNTVESTRDVLRLLDLIHTSSREGRRLACRLPPG
jgi:predicted dehydrogenase